LRGGEPRFALTCDDATVPLGEENLVLKAAAASGKQIAAGLPAALLT
jgi:hypothetical protein